MSSKLALTSLAPSASSMRTVMRSAHMKRGSDLLSFILLPSNGMWTNFIQLEPISAGCPETLGLDRNYFPRGFTSWMCADAIIEARPRLDHRQ
jgi:hypothetical protein